jgi:hypothetical protein
MRRTLGTPWSWSGWPTGGTRASARCRAGSAAGWTWRWRSPGIRSCCSWTSRPPASTRLRAGGRGSRSAGCGHSARRCCSPPTTWRRRPMVSKAGEREAFLLGGPLPGRSRAFISVWSCVWLAAVLAGVDGSRTAALLLTVFMVSIAVTWIQRMVALIRELRAAREQVARRMVRQDPAAAERELDQVGSLAQRSLAEVRAAVAGYGRSPWPVSWRAHGRRSAPPGSRARSGRGRARRYRECSVRMDDPRGRDECDPPQRRPPLRHHRARRRPSGCAPWGAGWRRAAPAAAASGWRRPSRTSDGRAGRAG